MHWPSLARMLRPESPQGFLSGGSSRGSLARTCALDYVHSFYMCHLSLQVLHKMSAYPNILVFYLFNSHVNVPMYSTYLLYMQSFVPRLTTSRPRPPVFAHLPTSA